MSEKMLKPGRDLLLRIREAFLGHGYDGLSMVTLAKACGFTRRSLYNYFNNKEDAFRALIRFDNIDFIQSGLEAGQRVRQRGGGALDVLAETMDVRYGYARRILSHSPHAVELTAEVQRRCRDILIEVATTFQMELEGLLISLERDGLLRLRPDMAHRTAAQMLADGARGVNQSLPPVPSDQFGTRYRDMCGAILYGCALERSSSGGAQAHARTQV